MGYPSQPLELPRDSTIRLLIRISHKTRLKLRPEETMKRSGAVRGMLGVISRQLGYRAVPVHPSLELQSIGQWRRVCRADLRVALAALNKLNNVCQWFKHVRQQSTGLPSLVEAPCLHG